MQLSSQSCILCLHTYFEYLYRCVDSKVLSNFMCYNVMYICSILQTSKCTMHLHEQQKTLILLAYYSNSWVLLSLSELQNSCKVLINSIYIWIHNRNFVLNSLPLPLFPFSWNELCIINFVKWCNNKVIMQVSDSSTVVKNFEIIVDIKLMQI